MKMEIKITPKKSINNQEKKLQIRSLFGEDIEQKNGLLAKVLVFLQINQPCSTNELKDKICKHYEEHIARTTISRAIKKLQDFGLIHETTPNELSFEGGDIPLKNHILAKYNNFLNGLPNQFRKNFGSMSYYWVSNGNGINYLAYCCKLLKFEIEGIKDEAIEEKQ